MTAPDTTYLLVRVREGDRRALEELLERILPRIEMWVRRKSGRDVASKFDPLDCVQDVALNLVQYLPKVEIQDSDALYGLLYRMAVNTLQSKREYLMARRRRLTLERPLDAGGSVTLDPPDQGESPSMQVSRAERQAWIRFALALLPEDDQELIFRHHYDGESFVEIGEARGTTPDTQRMRFNRAMAKLNSIVGKLKRGRAGELAAEFGEDDD